MEATKTNSHVELGWKDNALGASKVGMAALSGILQRESGSFNPDIAVNFVTPGSLKTALNPYGDRTVDEGAESPVYAALLPKNTVIKGQYLWSDCSLTDWVNGRV